ncbi:uncharacterized protein LOC142350651 [Convolutriloba macropyga]|uniref:uncharacterized protein LOC142350651 n=1 Tax=Convolutriloba macropyga TaxID=536237 RepID=UPI003F520A41
MAYDPYGVYRNASAYGAPSPYSAAAYTHHASAASLYGSSYAHPYSAAGAYGSAYGQPTAVVPPMTPGLPVGAAAARAAAQEPGTASAIKTITPSTQDVTMTDAEVTCYHTGYKAGCQAAIQQFRVVLQTMCLPQAEIRSLMAKIPTSAAADSNSK